MDAVKYIEEQVRMCKSFSNCNECPAKADGVCTCHTISLKNADDVFQAAAHAVRAVNEWSLGHPRKTRSSEFLKHYPNAIKYGDVIYICPKKLDESYKPCNGCSETSCHECRAEYWLQEVE